MLSKLDSIWGYSFVVIIARALELLKTCTYVQKHQSRDKVRRIVNSIYNATESVGHLNMPCFNFSLFYFHCNYVKKSCNQ